MPFIKELKIHGFKSFARETNIPFRETMNVIVGPNGSGKSNITDAICFVLGRLGSKSMRAKRLSNLIFAGTPKYKPSSESSVELVFDNTDKGFSVDEKQVGIKRILRRNGQSIYKINNEVRTRQEILELMAQAGIDPNGFNIVLQGEIDSFVKMPPDKRRQVIEEVAGISIYEVRKQRSIKELDKTEQKLKEVAAILRERNAYLRNLEQERKQALKFKKLKEDVKSFKASILYKTSMEKQEKIESINKQITNYQKEIAKINELIDKNNNQTSILKQKIDHITNNIQKASGLQQEKLNSEISDLRADLAGLTIRKQSYETQVDDMSKRKQEIQESIRTSEVEIADLSSSKGKRKNLKENLQEKQKKLEDLDERRRKTYVLKSNISALNSRIQDKERSIQKTKNESDFILNRIEQIEADIKIKEPIEKQQEAIASKKSKLGKSEQELEDLKIKKSENEKSIAVLETQIKKLEKDVNNIKALDTCPLCKTKLTKEHISKVSVEMDSEKSKFSSSIKNSNHIIKESSEKIEKLEKNIENYEQEIKTRSQDVLRLELINEKKQSLRKLSEDSKLFEKELKDIESKKDKLEQELSDIKTSEENYDTLRLEVQELQRHQEKNLGMEITMKQREIDRMKNILRQITREVDESQDELSEITSDVEQKQELLEEKNSQDQSLKQKFKKVLEEKNQHQDKIHFFERDLLQKQNNKQLIEQRMNEIKIERAQFLAQKEALEQESQEFKGGKIMRLPVEVLRKKLEETQHILENLGTVNMRALEVYEDVRKEYEKVEERSNKLLEEKQEILKIIEDIDKKKRKVFLKTLSEINKLFSRNFSQLSPKGLATLEPTNKQDIFEGGIDMLIKVGKGKYFDTHSLSGGEQSLISLSLIFAIQEYKPYCFYIFDEIDAALDRRNSERLATLLKRYMKQGQYLIITHNDSLITEAPMIYGVSMQDKISKVISLEV